MYHSSNGKSLSLLVKQIALFVLNGKMAIQTHRSYCSTKVSLVNEFTLSQFGPWDPAEPPFWQCVRTTTLCLNSRLLRRSTTPTTYNERHLSKIFRHESTYEQNYIKPNTFLINKSDHKKVHLQHCKQSVL